MKLNFRLLSVCLMLCAAFWPFNEAMATHAVGTDLTYTCLGNNQYQFEVQFFRDCDGISAPSTAVVTISSAQCNFSTNLTLSRVGPAVEISALCPSQIGNSTCNGGSLPGIEQYTYQATYTLPFQCSDWRIGFSECCRNNAITNLSNPGNYDLYVEATLNNTNGLCDNSPFFTSLPVPYVCAGDQFFYNHGAVDVDGDSLVYTMINPLDAAGVNVPYASGRSVTNPMATTGAFAFDPLTGQMSATPSTTQQAVITVRVDEYRNGVLIGSTMRDIQFVVINCPANNLPQASGVNGSQDYTIEVCAGSQTCFDIITSDADASQTVTISWNNGIAGGTFTSSGGSRPTGTFCWSPTQADVRPNSYQFTVLVQDDACPNVGSQVFSYSVFVRGLNVDLGPDQNLCASSYTISPSVTGGSGVYTYQWTGGSTDPTLTVNQSGTYGVTVTDPSGCTGSDDIVVTLASLGNADFIAYDDTTICAGSSVTLDAGSGFATYSWNTGATSQTITTSTAGVYVAEVTDQNGCTYLDSVEVILFNGLNVDITGDLMVCTGETTILDAGAGFDTYTWSTGETTQTISAPIGLYSVTVTDANGCFATDTVIVDEYFAPFIDLGPDRTTCVVPFNLIIRRPRTWTYLWNDGSTSPIYTVTQSGTYTVTATDDKGCSVVDSVTITIGDPDPALGPDITLCSGDTATITAAAGYTSYLWNTGETTQSIVTNVSGIYSVLVEDSLGCTGRDTIEVSASTPISLAATSTSVCGPGGASIDLTVSGGSAPYTYFWTGANGFTASTEDLNGVAFGTYQVLVTDANGCVEDLTETVSAPSAPVDAGPDTLYICPGDSVQLNATGAVLYNWSPDSTLTNAYVSNPTAFPATTTTYYVTGGIPSTNLVVNGDFESGNVGFSSNYDYTTTDLVPEGRYAVVADPNPLHSAFVGSDHTSGQGNFMAVNGSTTPGDNVWCQSVQVTPGTNYNFSTWISTLVANSPAQLEFSINGVTLGNPITAPSSLNTWIQFFEPWNSGADTLAEICIVNNNTIAGGNDFGLDDIVFTAVCYGEDSVTVVVNTPVQVDLGPAVDTLCLGSTQVLNPGANYSSYLWSDGSTGQTLAVTTAGVYSVTATDLNGCVTSDTIEIVTELCCFPANFGSQFTLIDNSNNQITADQVWQGKYYVTEDITVSGNAVLDLTNVDVVFLKGTGISFEDNSTIRANNSVFRACDANDYWDGFDFRDNASGTINESTFKNAETALDIQTSEFVNVSNNEFYNAAVGIFFDNAGNGDYQGGVTGNTFVSNADRPAYVDTAGNAVNDFFAIKVYNTVSSGIISQNDFVNAVQTSQVSNYYYGVYINTSSVSATSNTFTNMYRAFDVTGNGGSVTLENNNIEYTRRTYFDVYAIRITDINSSPLLVEGNNISFSALATNNNNQAAIYVNNARNLIISNNVITGFATGIRAAGGSRNLDILGNTISEASRFGIWLAGGVNYDVLENTLFDLDNVALYIVNVRNGLRVRGNDIDVDDYSATFGIRYIITGGNVQSANVDFSSNCIRNSSTAIQVRSDVANDVPVIYNNYLYNYEDHGLWNIGFAGSVGSCNNYPAEAGRNSFISNYLAPFGNALDVRSDSTVLLVQGNSANLVTNFPNVLVNTACNTTSNSGCGNQIGNNEWGGRTAGALTQLLMFQEMIEGEFPMTLNGDDYLLSADYTTAINAVDADERMNYIINMMDILAENTDLSELTALYNNVNGLVSANELNYVSYHYNILTGNYVVARNFLNSYSPANSDEQNLVTIEGIRVNLLIDGRVAQQLNDNEISTLLTIDNTNTLYSSVARDLVQASIGEHDYKFEVITEEPVNGDKVTGISLGEDMLEVYPNPAENTIVIRYNVTTDVEGTHIMISDVLGRIVYNSPVEFANGEVTVNVNEFASGAYIVAVMHNKEVVEHTKLIKK